MVSICRRCKLPGIRTKNAVKCQRAADLKRLSKIISDVNSDYRDFELDDYVWDNGWSLYRVSHAFEDMTKNLRHHGTHARFMTKQRRHASLKY